MRRHPHFDTQVDHPIQLCTKLQTTSSSPPLSKLRENPKINTVPAPTAAETRPPLTRNAYNYQNTHAGGRKGNIMHKYTENQSHVGSSGQTLTKIVSMGKLLHYVRTACSRRAYYTRRCRDTHPRLPITCLIARRSSNVHRITRKIAFKSVLLPPKAINAHAPASFVSQHGYTTPTISGPHLWVEWQHHPCLLGVSIVGRVQYGYITLAFSGSPWWGGFNMATSPLPSQGPHVGESSIWGMENG